MRNLRFLFFLAIVLVTLSSARADEYGDALQDFWSTLAPQEKHEAAVLYGEFQEKPELSDVYSQLLEKLETLFRKSGTFKKIESDRLRSDLSAIIGEHYSVSILQNETYLKIKQQKKEEELAGEAKRKIQRDIFGRLSTTWERFKHSGTKPSDVSIFNHTLLASLNMREVLIPLNKEKATAIQEELITENAKLLLEIKGHVLINEEMLLPPILNSGEPRQAMLAYLAAIDSNDTLTRVTRNIMVESTDKLKLALAMSVTHPFAMNTAHKLELFKLAKDTQDSEARTLARQVMKNMGIEAITDTFSQLNPEFYLQNIDGYRRLYLEETLTTNLSKGKFSFLFPGDVVLEKKKASYEWLVRSLLTHPELTMQFMRDGMVSGNAQGFAEAWWDLYKTSDFQVKLQLVEGIIDFAHLMPTLTAVPFTKVLHNFIMQLPPDDQRLDLLIRHAKVADSVNVMESMTPAEKAAIFELLASTQKLIKITPNTYIRNHIYDLALNYPEHRPAMLKVMRNTFHWPESNHRELQYHLHKTESADIKAAKKAERDSTPKLQTLRNLWAKCKVWLQP